MKILLLGKNGQLGRELSKSLLRLGQVTALDRSECDLATPEVIPQVIKEISPDIIVNAAAYTAVDKAEDEENTAAIVNGSSVAVLAEEAKKLNALFVHYSTDYVFDGLKPDRYTEEDSPCPINAYGRSKLLGENAVREQGGRYLIFRTSWVYSPHGSNFLKTMLRLAQERDELKVVADQIGAPTSAMLIADVTAEVLHQVTAKSLMQPITGLYHLTASGETSWYGFAQLLLKIAREKSKAIKLPAECVLPIPSEEYALPAKRPMNSRLDTTKLRTDYKITLPNWQDHVEKAVFEALSPSVV